MKQKKSPLIAAFLNFFVSGTGYIYNGKRIGFGIALLFADLIWQFNLQVFGGISFWGFLILAIALAYDAYREAEEINKSK